VGWVVRLIICCVGWVRGGFRSIPTLSIRCVTGLQPKRCSNEWCKVLIDKSGIYILKYFLLIYRAKSLYTILI
jgi:hypothetical protein